MSFYIAGDLGDVNSNLRFYRGGRKRQSRARCSCLDSIMSPRLRGRPKITTDDNQRDAIVQKAWALFIEVGFHNFTMSEVASRCKISKATIYRLFSSKVDLFAAIVHAHRQNMLALPGDYDDLPLDQALEHIFKLGIDSHLDRERVAFLRLALTEEAQFPELGAIFREHGADKSRSLLAEWLARQRASARIEIDDVDSAAKMLMDMIFGAIVVKSRGEFEWPGEEERKIHIRRCIHVFLNGVRAG
jgi:AcrR family transcriptional regulator